MIIQQSDESPGFLSI